MHKPSGHSNSVGSIVSVGSSPPLLDELLLELDELLEEELELELELEELLLDDELELELLDEDELEELELLLTAVLVQVSAMVS